MVTDFGLNWKWNLGVIYTHFRIFKNNPKRDRCARSTVGLYFFSLRLPFLPVMWVIISEIYPNRIKGVAMSFFIAVSWLCTFLTVSFVPVIQGALGLQYLFAIFGVFSIIAFVFVKIWIPETKGKILEQLEKELGLI